MSPPEPPAAPIEGSHAGDVARAWAVLEGVLDPEVPVLSVVDLGVVRSLVVDGSSVRVRVAPTYSGCPAVEVIERSIARALAGAGWDEVHVERSLSPPWTTDWISERGRRALEDYGIAPPPRLSAGPPADPSVRCPACASERTERLSEFGTTPCKALYRCLACLEPFEHFKCL